ncbi:HNH endonuclease signature motif containing protein [Marisediminicola senii]|uniref:HNH endonuclease signature motif containing protein n=1 Tax=Marisediminicola senii TaxID=2711233 RepID=UPI0013E9D0C6|nr:HNH endonuclease signature motif containing protein [Marisediminicola senii]
MASAHAVAEVERSAMAYASLDPAQFAHAGASLLAMRRYVDEHTALYSGEVARRSRWELGHQGLAQRSGYTNATDMVQTELQLTKREATRFVQTGTLLAEAEYAELLAATGADHERTDEPGSPSPQGDVSPGADAHPVPSDGTEEAQPGEGAPGSTEPPAFAPTPTPAPARILNWRERLAAAQKAGTLSPQGLDTIRRVLCEITSCDDHTMNRAADELIRAANGMNSDQLYRLARQLRDRIDAASIARREKQQHEDRYVHIWEDPNGMYRGSWALAPEDGALFADVFAQVLSPRRGVRFVDEVEQARAEALMKDPRTDDQLRADALMEMVQLAIDANAEHNATAKARARARAKAKANAKPKAKSATRRSVDADVHDDANAPVGAGSSVAGSGAVGSGAAGSGAAGSGAAGSGAAGSGAAGSGAAVGRLLGSRNPSVRVVITAERLEQGTGPGHIHGSDEALSIGTVERLICTTGMIGVLIDPDGQPLDVGRDKRSFTDKQRTALEVRDGGCRFPGCPRTRYEAHHINPWHGVNGEPGGNTDIADGICLCRHHHMMIHNNGWRVVRDRAQYFLKPPPDVDPDRVLIPMPSKSPIAAELRRQRPAAT